MKSITAFRRRLVAFFDAHEEEIRKQAIDMGLHALWAGAVAAIAWVAPGTVAGGLVTGLMVGSVHEFVVQRNPERRWYKSGWSRWLDLAGFVIGGAAVGALVQALWGG